MSSRVEVVGKEARPPRLGTAGHLFSAKHRERLVGLAFLAPALALFAVFVIYPVIYNAEASSLEWDGVNVGEFVGLQNYLDLLADPIFYITLRNSLFWILLTIIPQCVIGFSLAWVLNQRLRGRTVYRTLFFIPVVLSPVVVGITWQRILDPFSGVIAQVGRATDQPWMASAWLSTPSTAIFTVIFINVWMWMGFSMLFYLAGLQLLDESVLEAGLVDGASRRRLILHIVLPQLKATHLSLVMLGVIGSLKTFELVYVLTEGGPNHASEMLPTYTFLQAFRLQHVGYASAISMVLVVIAMSVSLGMMRVFGSGFLTGDDR